jgi:hypothetical protein
MGSLTAAMSAAGTSAGRGARAPRLLVREVALQVGEHGSYTPVIIGAAGR